MVGLMHDDLHVYTGATFTMETEFVEKLRELEQSSIKNTAAVEALRSEKELLMQDVLECERQVSECALTS